MLGINVAALLKSPAGTTRDIAIEELDPAFGPDLPLSEPLHGDARLFRTQDGIVVWCDLHTAVEVECSRCLEPVPVAVDAHFEEEFRPTINITTGAPLEAPEDEALRIDERHILDLTEPARQYLVTALPITAICSEACRGLCPRCGANLNEGPCACPEESPSNPFASLAGLLADSQVEERGRVR